MISSVWNAAFTLSLSRLVSKAREDIKFEYSGPREQIMAILMSSASRVFISNIELCKSLILSIASFTQAASTGRNSSGHVLMLQNSSCAMK